ncbi:hypothetical protein ABH927_006776 [Planotetraspora sp. GP83]
MKNRPSDQLQFCDQRQIEIGRCQSYSLLHTVAFQRHAVIIIGGQTDCTSLCRHIDQYRA